MRKMHLYAYYGLVLFFFALAYPRLVFLARKPQKNYQRIAQIRRWISLSSLRLAGIRIQILHQPDIDWSQNYIICPNHTSILDISILNDVVPPNFSFMGKVELLSNPVTRIFFKTIDIAVDRNSKVSSFKAFKQGDTLIKDGKSLVIFPEGKIDDEYPPTMHPFKAGPFRLATDNNKAILPVVIHNAWELLWDDGSRFGMKPGTIYLSILDPIFPNFEGREKDKDLADSVYKQMNFSWQMYNKS